MTKPLKGARIAGWLVVGLLLAGIDAASAQCAMCRTALASPEGQELASAFRASVVVLLATPIISFVTVAVLAVRRQRRRGSSTAS